MTSATWRRQVRKDLTGQVVDVELRRVPPSSFPAAAAAATKDAAVTRIVAAAVSDGACGAGVGDKGLTDAGDNSAGVESLVETYHLRQHVATLAATLEQREAELRKQQEEYAVLQEEAAASRADAARARWNALELNFAILTLS